MAKIVDLPSGAKLEMTIAGFEDAHRLLQAVTKEIEGVKVSGLDFKGIDFDAPITGELIDALKSLVSRVIYSRDIMDCLWICMARATRNNSRVTKEMFDDERAREDFLPIVKEVLMYNLTPFFKNLGSMFTGLSKAV